MVEQLDREQLEQLSKQALIRRVLKLQKALNKVQADKVFVVTRLRYQDFGLDC